MSTVITRRPVGCADDERQGWGARDDNIFAGGDCYFNVISRAVGTRAGD